MIHRDRIFKRFGNTRNGIVSKDFFQEAWKQRLEEMDTIFIDELIQEFVNHKYLKLETITVQAQRKIDEQNKKFAKLADNIVTHLSKRQLCG